MDSEKHTTTAEFLIEQVGSESFNLLKWKFKIVLYFRLRFHNSYDNTGQFDYSLNLSSLENTCIDIQSNKPINAQKLSIDSSQIDHWAFEENFLYTIRTNEQQRCLFQETSVLICRPKQILLTSIKVFAIQMAVRNCLNCFGHVAWMPKPTHIPIHMHVRGYLLLPWKGYPKKLFSSFTKIHHTICNRFNEYSTSKKVHLHKTTSQRCWL